MPRIPGMSRRPKSIGATILLLIVAAVGAYLQQSRGKAQSRPDERPRSTRTDTPRPPTDRPGDRPIERPSGDGVSDGGIPRLFREKQSDVIVRAGGEVVKILPDDLDTSDGSSQHQRFLLRLPTGDTVLVAHNIDLAPRVPVREGDVVRIKGEYEWTEKGGVVHWTHKDPRGRHAEGWIELAGKKYQ